MKKNPFLLFLLLFGINEIALTQNVKLLFNDYGGPESKPMIKKIPGLGKVSTPGKITAVKISRINLDDRADKLVQNHQHNNKMDDFAEVLNSPSKSPAASLVVEPSISNTIDPHIAAGRYYLVIMDYDDIGFFDKSGSLLAPKANGLPTRINADIFFQSFFDPINELLGLDKKEAVYQVNEFYDLRVIYDDNSRRFYIIAAARNQLWIADENTPDDMEKFSRRLVAFAVSKTEDPRDGFYQYMTTENNYRDWPRIAINGNHLLIANNAADGMGNGPAAYVFSVPDVKQGKPNPAGIKLLPPDLSGLTKVNVVTVLDNGMGYSCFLSCMEDLLTVLYFDKNASLQSKPVIKSVTVKLADKIGFLRQGAYVRNNHLYFTYDYTVKSRVANSKQAMLKIRYVRLPLVASSSQLMITSSGAGVLQVGFGKRSVDDDPADLVSYEEPAMAVNNKGDFLIGYGRTGYETKNTLFPEVRYTIFYNNESEHRRSNLLRKGEFLPMSIHKNETVSTTHTHSDELHYSSAAADPMDDSFWIIHVFAAKSGGYKTVVGNIKR